jgi:hypothetical protein
VIRLLVVRDAGREAANGLHLLPGAARSTAALAEAGRADDPTTCPSPDCAGSTHRAASFPRCIARRNAAAPRRCRGSAVDGSEVSGRSSAIERPRSTGRADRVRAARLIVRRACAVVNNDSPDTEQSSKRAFSASSRAAAANGLLTLAREPAVVQRGANAGHSSGEASRHDQDEWKRGADDGRLYHE